MEHGSVKPPTCFRLIYKVHRVLQGLPLPTFRTGSCELMNPFYFIGSFIH